MKRAHTEKSEKFDDNTSTSTNAHVAEDKCSDLEKEPAHKAALTQDSLPEEKKLSIDNSNVPGDESSSSDSDSFVGPAKPADLENPEEANANINDNNSNEPAKEEEEEEEEFQLKFVPQFQRKTILTQHKPIQASTEKEPTTASRHGKEEQHKETPKAKPKKLMFKGDKKRFEAEERKHKVKELQASELLDMRCKKKSDRHCN